MRSRRFKMANDDRNLEKAVSGASESGLDSTGASDDERDPLVSATQYT